MNASFSLNGPWELAFCPEDGAQPKTPEQLEASGLQFISATVPGNVECDLVAAGLEDDPYYGSNLYRFRKYEFYTWWYRRTFFLPGEAPPPKMELQFDGLDTFAAVWINGVKIGETANGLVEHVLAIPDGLLRAENTVYVHISSAVNRARAAPYPAAMRVSESIGEEMLRIRKAPHCFGWDIAPRLLSAGIWRDVTLRACAQTRLTEVYYGVRQASEERAMLEVRYRFVTDDPFLEGFHIRVNGSCGESSFAADGRALFVAGHITLQVEKPRLWWPRGYGDPDLYETVLELCRGDAVLDTYVCRVGLRTSEIERSYTGEDAGSFQIWVNQTRIMVRGTNWVPLDCLHSRDAARLDRAHSLLCDVGCNLVRCWGGNVYESSRFFDLCDERGILVWQDFSMACGIYDQGETFAREIADEARKVAIRLRNHPSLIVWAGDNEVDQFYSNVGYLLPHARLNRISRQVLPQVLAMHDPYRDYLESSPCLPPGVTDEYRVPEQHNWGPRDYFKSDFYRTTTAHFISEIGYHGCPPLASLRRYIPEGERCDFIGAPSMRTHCTEYADADQRGYHRNELMLNQVRAFFGVTPEHAEDLVLASQISQAEAKKYFIESTRLKKWRRTGVIWWNLLDGWPQISDAVVDYYFEKKLAYTYIKRVQEPVCLMLDEANDWKHRVVLANDTRGSEKVSYQIDKVGADGRREAVYTGSCVVSPGENRELPPISCIPGEKALYLLRWQCGGRRFKNHYLSGYPPFELACCKSWLQWIETA